MTASEHAATQHGQYIRANGLDIYYQEHGQGRPLLLIHGGTATAESWQPYLAAFAAHYRVITPDSRGHGHTANPLGRMSYRLLADDMAALVQALALDKPLICGYSDGGQVALEIGMRYPALPQALVIGAAWFKFSESYRTWLRSVVGDEHTPYMDIAQFERDYPDWAAWLQQTHGPDRWQTLLQQIKPMWAAPLNYTPEDFARVVAPTLVLVGDRDQLIPVEEAWEMYRLLPRAELAVVPGCDHLAFDARVDLFQPLILDFLLRRDDAAGGTASSTGML
jgi:pimeloyl-ACP methyl ester carboxylesterase